MGAKRNDFCWFQSNILGRGENYTVEVFHYFKLLLYLTFHANGSMATMKKYIYMCVCVCVCVCVHIHIYVYIYTYICVCVCVCVCVYDFLGLVRWLSGKELACQCRRLRSYKFDPWVGKIPWSRKWQPAPILLPGKLHGQWSLVHYSPWGHREVDTTEHARTHMIF